MNDAQGVVALELLVVVFLDYVFGNSTKTVLQGWIGMFTSKPGTQAANTAERNIISVSVFWLLGAAVLLGIANYWPRAGVVLASLLLVSVVLSRSDPIIGWANDVTGWLNGTASTSTASTSAQTQTKGSSTNG